MIRLIRFFSLLLLFSSCDKARIGSWDLPTCDSDSTSISVKVVDFYSKQALPNVSIQIYDDGFWSLWGPVLLKNIISDNNGLAEFRYAQDSLSSYHVKILPDPDTTYIYPWQLKVTGGCEHDWEIRMKPIQKLTLRLKNDGVASFGKSYISILRRQGERSRYQNDDIVSNIGYSFGSFQIDTVPVGFEKDFIFKVVPEEELEIQFGNGNIKRIEKIYTNNSNSGSFIFSI